MNEQNSDMNTNITNNNRSNIFDLPDEILFIIISQLNIVDVTDKLVDVNERFRQLALDPLYIRNLDVTDMAMNAFHNRTSSAHEQVLARICKNILPIIHNQVKKLALEQYSLERILTFNYSQLFSLALVHFKEEILFQSLTDNLNLRDLLTQQITHLNIDIRKENITKLSKISSDILVLILSLCKRLIYLNFCQVFSHRHLSIGIYKLPKTSCTSSILTELKINVTLFNDCLYLLDRTFDNLSKLVINVKKIEYKPPDMNNETKLPKLKYFSLTSFDYTHAFDEHIIPLLCRMINLEQLILFLSIVRVDSTLIDGIELYDQVLVHMSHLNKFVFNLNAGVIIKDNEINVPANEDIQRSFRRREEYGQVDSYVHFEPRTPLDGYTLKQAKAVVKSHIYSLPYPFETFLHLNNSFQGGMFAKVRYLTMTDTYPFEHQLFKIISNDFPFLKELIIQNDTPQEEKSSPSTLISFPHLTLLNVVEAHADYAEQFLVDKHTHLPCLLNLCITYESLAMVTKNFTNDATRLYCSQLKRLHIDKPFVRPKNFDHYFHSLL